MKYFFIYSAGGGAGDWNGVKRIWNDKKFIPLKSNVLLKFGDVFFNHASNSNLIRPSRWNNIKDLRNWLYENTQNDLFTLKSTNILLDSGSAKLVSWIANKYPNINCYDLITKFDKLVFKNDILNKYINIILESNINYAITFDIPNPFKIRSQTENTRLNILNSNSHPELIEASARYANLMYEILAEKGHKNPNSILMTTINGKWNYNEIKLFFSKLNYTPENLAVGGLSSDKKNSFLIYISNLLKIINFNKFNKVHFLGCGGLDKITILKNNGLINDNISVDVSTPINRAIDGNIKNTSFSGYYDYNTLKLIRIKISTKEQILNCHSKSINPLFNYTEMSEILDDILKHQSGYPSTKTYDSRAKLIMHNNDVFRQHAK